MTGEPESTAAGRQVEHLFVRASDMARPAVCCDCWRVFSPSDIAQVQGVTYLGLGFSS